MIQKPSKTNQKEIHPPTIKSTSTIISSKSEAQESSTESPEAAVSVYSPKKTEFLSTNQHHQSIIFPEKPLSILSSEVSRIKFIKDLYKIQCEIDPIKTNHVIPIIESTKTGQNYCRDLVQYHVKVLLKFLTYKSILIIACVIPSFRHSVIPFGPPTQREKCSLNHSLKHSINCRWVVWPIVRYVRKRDRS